MNKSFFTILILFFVAFVTQTRAQNLDEILDQHFKTIGQEKLAAVKTYSVKATIKQMGMEIPMEMSMKRPNKFRMEMDMQGQKMIQVYDGEKGWYVAPWISSEPLELEGAQLKQAMDQADIDGELYNYIQKGNKAELLGKEQLDVREVFNIKLTSENGDVKNYYMDADKYLIVEVRAKVNAMGQEVDIKQRMTDYKTFDGILMATKIESESPMGTGQVIINDVKFNQDMDDTIFRSPSK